MWTYNVYILGAVETSHFDKSEDDNTIKYLIDEKFMSPNTTDITCDFSLKRHDSKKRTITFNFTVTKPNEDENNQNELKTSEKETK